MGKPAFDPSQPFERTDVGAGAAGKPTFDPNQPFSATPEAEKPGMGEALFNALPVGVLYHGLKAATDPGAAQAGLEHYGNMATMGHLPQLQAAAEKIMPDPNSDLDARLRAAGISIQEPGNDYVTSRDANIARLTQEKKEHPTASLVGSGAGIVGNAILTGGALKAAGLMGQGAKLSGGLEGPVTQGAARLKNYLNALKVGAVMGAAGNPGDIPGEVNPTQLPERIKNAAWGAPLGIAGNAASEVVNAIPAKAQSLAELANEKSFKVLGAGKRAFKEAFGKDQVQTMGRQLLDEPGMLNVLQTPKGLAAKVEAAKDSAGGEIGNILDRVDAAAGDQAALQEAAKTRGDRFLENYVGKKSVLPDTVDTGAIADNLSGGKEAAFLAKTPGMEGASSRFQSALDTLKKNGDVSLREAQALRQGIDKSINFGKRVPEMSGSQQGLYEIRDAIRNKMNEVVDNSAALAGSGSKDALLKANRRYAALSTMDEILDDKIAGDAARRTASLGDHLSSGTGATVGAVIAGPPGAAIGGATGGIVSKIGRTFGNSIQARGYDALSKILARLPPGIGEQVSQNPGELQSLLASLAQPVVTPAPLPMAAIPPTPQLGGVKRPQNRAPSKSSLRLKALGE